MDASLQEIGDLGRVETGSVPWRFGLAAGLKPALAAPERANVAPKDCFSSRNPQAGGTWQDIGYQLDASSCGCPQHAHRRAGNTHPRKLETKTRKKNTHSPNTKLFGAVGAMVNMGFAAAKVRRFCS